MENIRILKAEYQKEICNKLTKYQRSGVSGQWPAASYQQSAAIAFSKLMSDLHRVEERADQEGWISEEETDKLFTEDNK